MDAKERKNLVEYLYEAVNRFSDKRVQKEWSVLDTGHRMLKLHLVANGIQTLENKRFHWIGTMTSCAGAGATNELVVTTLDLAHSDPDEPNESDKPTDPVEPTPLLRAIWQCAARYYRTHPKPVAV